MNIGTRVSTLVLVLLVTGCVSAPQSRMLIESPPSSLDPETVLTHVPFYPQERYQCGPAALAMLLNTAGVDVHPDDLVNRIYVPGKHGSYRLELVTAGRDFGRMVHIIKPGMATLLEEIDSGNPVLVLQNLGLAIYPKWHFAVVKGYNLEHGTLLLNSGTLEDYSVPMKVFERTWARGEYWGIVANRPGELPATATSDEVFSALSVLEEKKIGAANLDQFYRAATARWPDHTNIQMGYGNLLFSMEHLDDAAAVFAGIISSQPGYAPAFNNLAFILYQQGRYQEALTHSRTAMDLGGEFLAQFNDTHALITAAMASEDNGR